MSHLRASDAQLLAASVNDAGAFRVLYDRYAQRIHRYHMRRRHDEEVALDLVAESFGQAWGVRRAFRDEAGGSAAPWLYGIARNVLLQSVRRERLEDSARQRLGALELADRPRVAPEESWLEGVDELLDTLPAEQRRVLELRVVEDMPYGQIATHLAITPENAPTRVHRALKALRDHPAGPVAGSGCRGRDCRAGRCLRRGCFHKPTDGGKEPSGWCAHLRQHTDVHCRATQRRLSLHVD